MIVIDAREEGQDVVLTYTDDGCGMDEMTRSKMFDPFFTTSRGTGSSGLGMHIVHNIVTQQLRGSIICETGPGQGVKFILRLPKFVYDTV